jgi:hypothetical protein
MRYWLGSNWLTLGLLGLGMSLLCLSGQEDIAVEGEEKDESVSASELNPSEGGTYSNRLNPLMMPEFLRGRRSLG